MSIAGTSHANRVSAFEKGYLATCVLLFVYGVLEWQGIVGDGRPWRPISFMALSGGMVLQALVPIVRLRSARASYLLMGASLVALGYSLAAR